MSAQDRQAERAVADFYDESVRPEPEAHAPGRAKRFGMAFLTGIAVGSTLRKLVK